MTNGVIKKAQVNPTNWQFSALSANKAATPPIVSLKEKFPPCYKQIWNNCTSNAVLAVDAYYYHNPKGSWIPSTVFTYYNQRKMDGTLKGGDYGSSVETALNAVRKYGACNSTVWANETSYKKKPTKAAYDDGLKGHELTKYYAVKNLSQIKKALANGYPVVCSMVWAFKTCDGATWTLNEVSKAEAKKCNKGHAVVIVGYNDELERFEIRNSFGSTWCNHGYAYVTYNTMKNTIWWDDSYAVVK